VKRTDVLRIAESEAIAVGAEKVVGSVKSIKPSWLMKVSNVSPFGNFVFSFTERSAEKQPSGERYDRSDFFVIKRVQDSKEGLIPNLEGLNGGYINMTQRRFLHHSNSESKLESRKSINRKIMELLNRNIWPFRDLDTSKLIKEYVKTQQRTIASQFKERGNYDKLMINELGKYIRELPFVLMAIQKVKINSGSKTPGVDRIILDNDEDALRLAGTINYKFMKSYKSQAIRRVFIPKEDDQMRPLVIPTITDRIVQEIFRSVLDPVVDVFSDPNSYGYRIRRSATMALGAVANRLQKNPGNRIILDYDIKSFFDTINKIWILDHFPFPEEYKHILVSWLATGLIYKEEYEFSETAGTHGGIISPLIANFVLNGLETKAFENCKGSISIDGKVKEIKIGLIRYVDDFVILVNDERNIDIIEANIQNFLSDRGLTLNKEKSKIVKFDRDNSFEFLGFTFFYVKNPKVSTINYRREITDMGKVLVYPSRSKVIEFKRRLKKVIASAQNLTAYELIKKLNPMLIG
jgi:group II intron reverse transcriptase/maturase